MLILSFQVGDRHIAEKRSCVAANPLIHRHKREIGIQLCCFFIVVSGTDLRDILNALRGAPGDQTDFGMDFISLKSVDYLASGIFKHLRPVDIVLLVEPCAQLHQNGNIFSIFSGADQIIGQPGSLCQTIDGNADGEHRRIAGSFPQKAEKRFHLFIGIAQKDIAPLQLREYRLPFHNRPTGLGRKRNIADLLTCTAGKIGEIFLKAVYIGHTKGCFAAINLIFAQTKLIHQYLIQLCRQFPLIFQAHRRQAFALFQYFFHMETKILLGIEGLVVLFAGNISVSGYRNNNLSRNRIFIEFLIRILQNRLLGHHIPYRGTGKQNDRRYRGGYWKDCNGIFIFSAQH